MAFIRESLMDFKLGQRMATVRVLNENTIDVFMDYGWLNWTRFEMKRMKGKVFLNKVGGKPLSEQDFRALCQQLQ